MLKQLYFWFFGPIYRRLANETESRIQRFESEREAVIEERVRARLSESMASEAEKRIEKLVRLHMEFQEAFVTKFTDQIVGAHLEIERLSALIGLNEVVAGEEDYSDELIAKILSRISREAKITELAAEYQIPLRNILIWRSKYNKMDAAAITRHRELERENANK